MFPPAASLRLTTDLIAYTVAARPAVEPDQHLQLPPAGGRRDAGAGARLRAVHRDRGARRRARLRPGPAGALRRRGRRGCRSSSTPACASSRRCARCAPSSGSGTSSRASATASTDAKQRRFRYGVQVNSLGLTEAQPENNVARIVLEMLAVTLSKDARARAVQLPAWNEALGLPRPWDQQWSLRHAAGAGLRVRPARVRRPLRRLARGRGRRSTSCAPRPAPRSRGSRRWAARSPRSRAATSSPQLVASHARRRARIESGEDVVVGVNRFTETEPNPLLADLDTAIQTVDPAVEAARGRGAARPGGATGTATPWRSALDALRADARRPTRT